jgi:hypothetical protein
MTTPARRIRQGETAVAHAVSPPLSSENAPTCQAHPEKAYVRSPSVFRHATLRRHLASILAEGLDPARATDAPARVWLHTPGRTPWAVLHIVRRHGVALTDVILLDVHVPRPWLQQAERGLWTCDRVIAPTRLRVGESGYDVAASPIPDT